MPAALHSVPTGTDVGADESSAGPPAGHDPTTTVRNDLVYFAHLARLSLPLSDLDAQEIDEIRRDLAVLVAEATRARLRPPLLHALLGAVLAELLPALPPASRSSLHEARPLIDIPTDTTS